MTTVLSNPSNSSDSKAPGLASRLVNGILAIKPLAALAKNRARTMMIKRAESIGVYWPQEVAKLRSRKDSTEFSADWDNELAQVTHPALVYPDYYTTSFHAYADGNLGWEPAMEVEVAAHAVHARIWPDGGADGDARLRQSYHEVLKQQIATMPQTILDIGCSVGMSTFALQALYPQAKITGLDLSPYFLAIAQYRSQQRQQEIAQTDNNSRSTKFPYMPLVSNDAPQPIWVHAAAESTGLPDQSFDLVSAHLLFHELPKTAAIAILNEARRLLRPGGYFTLMDMNPHSEIYAKMPPYILTLLKSTEPYLDQYFSLDISQALIDAGFSQPTITCNTPRHRTVVARVKE